MKLTIDNFDKKVSAATSKKAHDYVNKGQLDEIEQSGKQWIAFVREKTNDFDVSFELNNSAISNITCDCESEEDLCEHVLALIIHVRNTSVQNTDNEAVVTKTTKGAKAKTPLAPKKSNKPDTFATLLEKAPPNELRAFIKEAFAHNKIFKSMFMNRFASISNGEGKEKYALLVENTLKVGLGRSNYIEWADIKKVKKPLDMFVKQGQNLYATKNYADATYLGQAFFEKLLLVVENTYDEELFRDYARDGLNLLALIIRDQDVPHDIKDNINIYFKTILSEKAMYRTADFLKDVLDILLEWANTKTQLTEVIHNINNVLALLEKKYKNQSYYTNYYIGPINELLAEAQQKYTMTMK